MFECFRYLVTQLNQIGYLVMYSIEGIAFLRYQTVNVLVIRIYKTQKQNFFFFLNINNCLRNCRLRAGVALCFSPPTSE